MAEIKRKPSTRKPKATPKPSYSGPTVALALGGGGARGLAHIHILEALDELGIRPVAISGSSIGAIMGAAYASGMSGREIGDYSQKILSSRTEVAARVWQARRKPSFKEVVTRGFRLGQMDVERIIGAFLPPQVPELFSQLQIPLSVTATDYFGHKLHVMEEGKLLSAIGASAALPAVFQPVRRDGKLLLDGGLYNPVPFDLLKDKADIVIAIDVVGAPEQIDNRTPGSIDLMFGSSQLMMQSIIDGMLRQDRPHILLRPPVSRFRVLDFMKFEKVMAESASIKDDLKREIEAVFKARR